MDQENSIELKTKEMVNEQKINDIKIDNDGTLNTLREEISKKHTEMKELEEYNRQEICEVQILHETDQTQ
jgi:dephospho-CoA kinase